uniref:Sec12-like protein 2 n=1 Tax=Tanacetum cinerariifolium TaxID=118510 RepID=A0A6L2LNU4_TANCI|nr:sec12-like protein 2 [Tanacetum cinerariifolium]
MKVTAVVLPKLRPPTCKYGETCQEANTCQMVMLFMMLNIQIEAVLLSSLICLTLTERLENINGDSRKWCLLKSFLHFLKSLTVKETCLFSPIDRKQALNDDDSFVNRLREFTSLAERSGPGRVWDISSSVAKASLPSIQDEIFRFCSGTIQGDVHILCTRSMKVHTVVKKAHLGLVTALLFSSVIKGCLELSFDSDDVMSISRIKCLTLAELILP